MILSLLNLRAGLRWWHNKKGWPKDIYNNIYYDIYRAKEKGPTERWWHITVDNLSRWHAYRGPKQPNTKINIFKRGKRNLTSISSEYNKLIAITRAEPSICDLKWKDVQHLFTIASKIKPTSRIFASKMCHFLFPRLFIVMDNLATGVFYYEFYWQGMKDEWIRFKDKSEAKNLLLSPIRFTKPPHPLYPFETKIMELCYIGYKHG